MRKGVAGNRHIVGRLESGVPGLRPAVMLQVEGEHGLVRRPGGLFLSVVDAAAEHVDVSAGCQERAMLEYPARCIAAGGNALDAEGARIQTENLCDTGLAVVVVAE